VSITIDKGVPIPDGAGVRDYGCKYPWADMEVGDSFFTYGIKAKSLQSMGYRYGRNRGMRFLAVAECDGVRIWRTE
jgi:hypothetical protein